MQRADPEPTHPDDLVISRLVKAPRRTVWRTWTEPKLLVEWFCPKPWTTELKAFDLRPGGGFHTLMRGPDGGVSDNPGCFLEIVQLERLVFTTQLGADWRPQTSWMPLTAVISLADEGEHTRYVARVMHPDRATRDRHEELGFFEGWNTCIAQLEEFARTLR
ncbi:MAG: SRPBCC family protein [Planctomycetaceae bacterium]|nr:SRPBCC family protein [Planctomycetaceae bacterium]